MDEMNYTEWVNEQNLTFHLTQYVISETILSGNQLQWYWQQNSKYTKTHQMLTSKQKVALSMKNMQ